MAETVLDIDNELLLRTWRMDDAGELFAFFERNRRHLEQFQRWVMAIQTPEDAVGHLRKAVARNDAGAATRFGIFGRGAADEILGGTNLFGLDPGGRPPEFGIWIGKEAEGRGVAHRAANRLLDHAATLGLESIQFRHRPANTRSEAFIKRLGFAFEQDEPDAERDGETLWDLSRYRLSLVGRQRS